eukprot:TRINITY_DN791_c0_g1_i4.p1 TRINITY_DN791_c0_g1~~TRINITY_DN791_c0_g1_i4.p1  ORF type:complete len:261 (+),score=10.99 TRINITY_DN791_c0_g1_i4:50-832(+)
MPDTRTARKPGQGGSRKASNTRQKQASSSPATPKEKKKKSRVVEDDEGSDVERVQNKRVRRADEDPEEAESSDDAGCEDSDDDTPDVDVRPPARCSRAALTARSRAALVPSMNMLSRIESVNESERASGLSSDMRQLTAQILSGNEVVAHKIDQYQDEVRASLLHADLPSKFWKTPLRRVVKTVMVEHKYPTDEMIVPAVNVDMKSELDRVKMTAEAFCRHPAVRPELEKIIRDHRARISHDSREIFDAKFGKNLSSGDF